MTAHKAKAASPHRTQKRRTAMKTTQIQNLNRFKNKKLSKTNQIVKMNKTVIRAVLAMGILLKDLTTDELI